MANIHELGTEELYLRIRAVGNEEEVAEATALHDELAHLETLEGIPLACEALRQRLQDILIGTITIDKEDFLVGCGSLAETLGHPTFVRMFELFKRRTGQEGSVEDLTSDDEMRTEFELWADGIVLRRPSLGVASNVGDWHEGITNAADIVLGYRAMGDETNAKRYLEMPYDDMPRMEDLDDFEGDGE